MKKLNFVERGVVMAISLGRFFKGVGMDDGRPVFNMNVHKQRNATVVTDKDYRQ